MPVDGEVMPELAHQFATQDSRGALLSSFHVAELPEEQRLSSAARPLVRALGSAGPSRPGPEQAGAHSAGWYMQRPATGAKVTAQSPQARGLINVSDMTAAGPGGVKRDPSRDLRKPRRDDSSSPSNSRTKSYMRPLRTDCCDGRGNRVRSGDIEQRAEFGSNKKSSVQLQINEEESAHLGRVLSSHQDLFDSAGSGIEDTTHIWRIGNDDIE